MNKLCQNCNEKIIGRSDKRFCDDQCRNQYNNNRLRDQNNRMRNINNILRRNRQILKQFETNSIVEKETLIALGFQFRYFTHKDVYSPTFYIYDIGYQKQDENCIKIEVELKIKV